MKIPLFTVLFIDGTIYYGKTDYADCGWKEIPNNSIKKIFFRIPSGDYLVLSEYDKYYRYTEATQILTGENAGKTKLEYVHILGQRKNKIIEYKINIILGNIKVYLYDSDNEYIKNLNPMGWKN